MRNASTRGTFRPERLSGEPFFRWRGGDVSRLEGLADAVFALALTLLVVRLDVPQTFGEVRFALARAPIYIGCFAIFLWIWYCHYQFHRRYGLEDPLTIAIDGAILFMVLLFAPPLRFVAELMVPLVVGGAPVRRDLEGGVLVGADGAPLPAMVKDEGWLLMSLYAGGFALLFGLFALQTWNALRRREALQLDELEVAVTRGTIVAHTYSMCVGLVALAVAVFGQGLYWLSGPMFSLLGPGHAVLGARQYRRLAKLARALGPSADAARRAPG
ncbi:MAG: TMEM175 family protein [Planctomycetota bacterium]